MNRHFYTFAENLNLMPIDLQKVFANCEGTPQSGIWHPEAPQEKIPHNVLAHIKIVYNRAVESNDIDLIFAALFHDLGKAFTTELNKKGNWSAHGHEQVSCEILKKYRNWIENFYDFSVNFDNVFEI